MQSANVQDDARLDRQVIEDYISSLSGKVSKSTARSYRSVIEAFWESLASDEEKNESGAKPQKKKEFAGNVSGSLIREDSAERFAKRLLDDGYSAVTVRKKLVIVNGLLEFLGRRDLQIKGFEVAAESEKAPELTKAEYLRLLSAAKQLDDRRGYLLVKLLAAMELPANFAEEITVEAAKAEMLIFTEGGGARLERFPGGMAQELQDFAREQGIASGPVFRARDGGAMKRENVHYTLQRLCRAAQVDARKGNVKALRRLREATRRELEAQINVEALVRQMWERVLEGEEGTVGW